MASSRVSLGDQKKNVDELLMMTPDGPGLQSSFSSESEDDSPSTKFSKLRVNYTPGVHNRTKAASSVSIKIARAKYLKHMKAKYL